MDTKPSSMKHKNILVSWEDKKPLVARIWRGRTRRDKADAYAEILQASTHLIASKPNNLGVQMFRNDKDDVSEFMVMSYWPSVESMSAWSADVRRVRALPEDEEFLLELPEFVDLYEMVSNRWVSEK